MSMFELLHLWGVLIIQELQLRLQNVTGLLLFLSHLGDPKIAFNIYFPAAYFFHYSIGKRVLWAAVVSEWLNSVAKWLFHGERPYWWIYESGVFNENVLDLKQFNITCETGPGSPSGHAMVTSAVWYIFISDFLYYKQIKSPILKFACWASYLIILLAVCVSRLYIATHFPHQVIAGVIVGIFLGQLMNSLSTSSLYLHHYLAVSVLLTVMAAVTYIIVSIMGVDPFWSLALASKWCALKEWVHLDTTLFYCIVRDVSSLLGLGLAVSCSHLPQEKNVTGPAVRCVQFLLAVLTILSVDKIKFSSHNAVVFYLIAFAKHSSLVFFVSAGIPVMFNYTAKLLKVSH